MSQLLTDSGVSQDDRIGTAVGVAPDDGIPPSVAMAVVIVETSAPSARVVASIFIKQPACGYCTSFGRAHPQWSAWASSVLRSRAMM